MIVTALLVAGLIVVLLIGWLGRRRAPTRGTERASGPGTLVTVTVLGTPRRAWLCLDPARRGHGIPRPLVLGFHGGSGNPAVWMQRTSLMDAAQEADFALMLPEALNRWADGRASVEGGWRTDAAMIGALLDKLSVDDDIDPARLFAVGSSNGAMMALRLACEGGVPLRGVAAVMGAMPEDYAARVPDGPPVPVMIVAGTADPMIPYGGGEVPSLHGMSAGGRVLGHAETVAFWCRRNRCRGKPELHRDRIAGSPAQIRIFEAAATGADVWSVTLEGAGHRWPSARPGPDAGKELETLIMEFFERKLHVVHPPPPRHGDVGSFSEAPQKGQENRWQQTRR